MKKERGWYRVIALSRAKFYYKAKFMEGPRLIKNLSSNEYCYTGEDSCR